MKQVWKTPQLEVLDVSKTMKTWPPGVGAEPGGPEDGEGENPEEDGLDS